MLVLTRKANQQIQIGESVVLTILQIKGNTVRVGIEAPREVRVIRGELRGLDADRATTVEPAGRPAPESVVSPATAETGVPTAPSSLALRREFRRERMLPGQAAAAVADFTPIRRSARLGNGRPRGLALPRR